MIKRLIIILGIIVVLAALYFGAYLPYQKSRLGLLALYQIREAKSVVEIEDKMNIVLNYFSPIGQEEITYFITDALISLISRLDKTSANQAAPQLAAYLEKINEPIIKRGGGFNLAKALYSLGRMNQFVWIQTDDTNFAAKAEDYYKRCLQESPRRVQCLYGLLDLYGNQKSRSSDAIKIGEEILRYWPTDNDVREILEKLKA